MKKTLLALSAAVFAALAPGAASAATLAFSPASQNAPADYQAGTPVNLAMVFTANANLHVSALGFYDIPDLADSETLGLYDASGNLLAMTKVTNPDTLVDGYYFNGISPVTLTAGDTYSVVAQVNINPWQYGTLAPTPPQITFQFDAYDYTNGLHDWTNTGGSGPAYFGPNLQFSVPEPAAWALMLFGVGLLGASLRIGRQEKATAAA